MEHKKSVFSSFAKGKLLLSGEYFVLDGASALALPVRYGQWVRVETWKEAATLSWTSKNEDGVAWYLAEFALPELEVISDTDRKVSENLKQILKACQKQNPDFLNGKTGLKALTQNTFPRNWGLGTSSTLIAALGRWAEVNPYRVLFETMGGSGYDIACAYAEGPLLYRLEGQSPHIESVVFDPPFAENLYFVYLGKKQDSRSGIQQYRNLGRVDPVLIAEVSTLSFQLLEAKDLASFEQVLWAHERLVSSTLDIPTAQSLHFRDYWGVVKSLGAWGGDFVLVTSTRGDAETRRYFLERGFSVVLGFREMGVSEK
ncbi:MAG: GHMP kinase [Bacteroidetes bacterium]|nr:GHMP kinase [Bacteroidota bacterium]